MEEIWKAIPNYDGVYEASSLGRIKSFKNIKEKILKQSLINSGYYKIILCKDNLQKTRLVHQLIAEAFLGHVNGKSRKIVVDHINDNKTDNRVENLQIVTQRFNANKTQGRYSSQYKGVGWDKRANKWRVMIMENNKNKYLGSFDCELKAHLVYVNKVKQML